MSENPLNERLEAIRKRYATKLEPKINEIDSALTLLSGEGKAAIEAVAATYRRFHEICGTGRTLGFEQVGQAAHQGETILQQPFRAGRALTDTEVAMLREALDALRAAAGLVQQSGSIESRGQRS